ncbi:hypothetical protein H9P43_007757 [Blastocladiella emersonii ATCC 22665]|nr:hypothetical protein H9P43_007757 [Blastocladiella emersonii ATCC 22665]
MVVVVRALYDYDGGDTANLSFRADDLIQVFTQLESGWWDGLLREERGWFPSNYVTPPLILRSRAEEAAWVKRIAADGQAFWYNEATGESAWERTNNVLLLPDGWSLQETDDGQGTFFYHDDSDEMSWTLPALMWENDYLAGAMPDPPSLEDTPAQPPSADPSPTAAAPSAAATGSVNGDAASVHSTANSNTNPRASAASASTAPDSDSQRRPSNASLSISAPPADAPPAAASTTAGSPTPSTSAASITSQSSPAERQMKAWSLLTQQIFSAIQRLLKSAKASNKAMFIPNSSHIVDAIRAMLHASGAVDKEAPAVKNNPALKTQHRALLGSLSKLVLAAKLASGVWPPPDAVQKMIGEASDLLAAVRGFVEAARACSVEVKTDILDEKEREERERAEQAAAAAAAAQPDLAPAAEPRMQHQRASDPRTLSISLATHESVQQLDAVSSSVLSTLGKLYANTQESITVATLLTLTRTTVTEVGQFLSLIEEVQLEEGPDSPLLHEFKIHKQSLYNNIAGLVMATSQATDPLAPPNAMEQVVVSITVVERSVKDLLASTQQLLDAKYRREHRRSSMAASAVPLSPVSPFPQQKPVGGEMLALNTELANSAAARAAQQAYAPRSASAATFHGSSPIHSPPYQSSGVSSYPGPARATSMASSPPATPYSAKLRRFFGDDVDPSTIAGGAAGARGFAEQQEEQPWFLAYDYAPSEIVFNMEAQVKGGTLPALVERLTLHDQFDAAFMTGFLFSYRTFMTSADLINCLMARFSIQPPQGLSDAELEVWIEKKMTPVRLRVFNVMKTWLEHYCLPYIPDDLAALDHVRNWARTVMRPVMATSSVQLIKLVEKRESSATPHLPLRPVPPVNGMTPVPPTGPPPAPVLPRSLKKLKFTELDPLEVARQLTLIEFSYFTRLIYTEFLNKAWSADRGSAEEAKARAPNLRRMVEMSNSVTGWVAESILAEEDPKKRCSLLKHYILIADRCKSLNNYNTLFSILAALNSAPIHRLSRTWEMLSSKTTGVLNDLRAVTDPHKNFATYRELLHAVVPPCIPFLGRYLSDLTFLEDGNPNVLKVPGMPDAAASVDGADAPQPLVNFSKRQRTADIIREIQQFQVLPFHLKPVPEVQEYLLNMINHNRESGELYEISLNREPREREDQKLVRLLEEAGLF